MKIYNVLFALFSSSSLLQLHHERDFGIAANFFYSSVSVCFVLVNFSSGLLKYYGCVTSKQSLFWDSYKYCGLYFIRKRQFVGFGWQQHKIKLRRMFCSSSSYGNRWAVYKFECVFAVANPRVFGLAFILRM